MARTSVGVSDCEPDTATFLFLVVWPAAATYSLKLLCLLYAAAVERFDSFAIEAFSPKAARFFGGNISDNFENSTDDGSGLDSSIDVLILDHGTGEREIGDGRGVISGNGPSPGDDMADAGDREPPVRLDAPNDLILELRMGRVFLISISRDNLDLWPKEDGVG